MARNKPDHTLILRLYESDPRHQEILAWMEKNLSRTPGGFLRTRDFVEAAVLEYVRRMEGGRPVYQPPVGSSAGKETRVVHSDKSSPKDVDKPTSQDGVTKPETEVSAKVGGPEASDEGDGSKGLKEDDEASDKLRKAAKNLSATFGL